MRVDAAPVATVRDGASGNDAIASGPGRLRGGPLRIVVSGARAAMRTGCIEQRKRLREWAGDRRAGPLRRRRGRLRQVRPDACALRRGRARTGAPARRPLAPRRRAAHPPLAATGATRSTSTAPRDRNGSCASVIETCSHGCGDSCAVRARSTPSRRVACCRPGRCTSAGSRSSRGRPCAERRARREAVGAMPGCARSKAPMSSSTTPTTGWRCRAADRSPDRGRSTRTTRTSARTGERGQSLVVYHHMGTHVAGAAGDRRGASRAPGDGDPPRAARSQSPWRFATGVAPRVSIFVVPAPAHDGRLRARTSAFLSCAWGRGHPPHFEGMKWPSRAADAPGGAPRPGRPARDDGGGAPKPTIHVSLLAGFGVTVDGVDRKVPEAASRLAALLALRPGRFSRFLVARTLRPDLGRPGAARHLRGALRRLRASTSPAIVESGRETVRLASHVDGRQPGGG